MKESWCVPCHAGLEESGTKHASSNPTAAQTIMALASHLLHAVKVELSPTRSSAVTDVHHSSARVGRRNTWENGVSAPRAT